MSETLCFLTIRQAARLIERKALSPVELTRAHLDRIEAFDPQLQVFVRAMPEAAIAEARAAEREILAGHYRGPLHGIPVGIKDVFDVAGVATTGQSRLLLENVPGEDAAAVRRLREAGAVLLGKVTTHEFAVGGPSFDLPFPPARNPWDLEAFTGGSSSGSAAGLAAGLMMGSIGSDTGGSIRTPAAFCGVTGLKPSFGRIGRSGLLPLSATLDHSGPMARTADDLQIMLAALAGPDPKDSATVAAPPLKEWRQRDGLQGTRIGVVRHFFEADRTAAAEVRAAIDAALATMARLGADIVDTELSDLNDYYACFMVIFLSEAFAEHRDLLCDRPREFGAITRIRLGMGALIGASDYLLAQRRRQAFQREVETALRDVDLLVTAATFGAAPRVEAVGADALFVQPNLFAPFNVTGHPALVVPCGVSDTGLPLALQIVGRTFDESTLLQAAHAYERAAGWVDRRPPDFA